MGATVDTQAIFVSLILTFSILLALAGAAVMALGIYQIRRDMKRQRIRMQAWRQTVAMLDRSGMTKKVVIYSDRNGAWRCTVNRRHDASECDGYHVNHDDI